MYTYELNSVGIWVLLDIFRQVSVRRPLGDVLERFECESKEWGNVRVFQIFQHYSITPEGLWGVVSGDQLGESEEGDTNLLDHLRFPGGLPPYTSSADLGTVAEGRLGHMMVISQFVR